MLMLSHPAIDTNKVTAAASPARIEEVDYDALNLWFVKQEVLMEIRWLEDS